MKRFLLVVLVYLLLNLCWEKVCMIHLESLYNTWDEMF